MYHDITYNNVTSIVYIKSNCFYYSSVITWFKSGVRSVHISILPANLYGVPTAFEDLTPIFPVWPTPHPESVL